MPDDLVFPVDLIALQRDRLAAQAAIEAYADGVDARLRAAPDPEQPILGRRWSDAERAELERLRAERDRLAAAVRAHPFLVEAHEGGRWDSTWDKLQAVCRQAVV